MGWDSQRGRLQLALPEWEDLEELAREGPAAWPEWERGLLLLGATGERQVGAIHGLLAFAPGPRQ